MGMVLLSSPGKVHLKKHDSARDLKGHAGSRCPSGACLCLHAEPEDTLGTLSPVPLTSHIFNRIYMTIKIAVVGELAQLCK